MKGAEDKTPGCPGYREVDEHMIASHREYLLSLQQQLLPFLRPDHDVTQVVIASLCLIETGVITQL